MRRGGSRIFVGDVQGCAEELEALLARAERELGPAFELWQVGDLVNRGPDNLRVLCRVRERVDAGRGRVVLGNHDLSLLRLHLGLRARRPTDSVGDVLDHPDADEWFEWLRRRPLLESGSIRGEPFVMVHAAVPPGVGLARLERKAARIAARLGGTRKEARALLAADPAEDPDAEWMARLTTCRSVRADGSWSSAVPERPEDAWHERFRSAQPGFGVVYGHWALQRLHVAPGVRGLDTGCVHHGRGAAGFLTAWLPDLPRAARDASASAFAVPDERFWHEPARRRYYDPEGAQIAGGPGAVAPDPAASGDRGRRIG